MWFKTNFFLMSQHVLRLYGGESQLWWKVSYKDLKQLTLKSIILNPIFLTPDNGLVVQT